VKIWFSCFPILPGSAEAPVTWGGILKHFLIAYFIDNISAKKISKSVHVCQSYSKPQVGRFFETRCIWLRKRIWLIFRLAKFMHELKMWLKCSGCCSFWLCSKLTSQQGAQAYLRGPREPFLSNMSKVGLCQCITIMLIVYMCTVKYVQCALLMSVKDNKILFCSLKYIKPLDGWAVLRPAAALSRPLAGLSSKGHSGVARAVEG